MAKTGERSRIDVERSRTGAHPHARQAVEVELKFQVPAAQRVALRRAVATAAVQRTRLQAAYVDTAAQHLAAAGLALRLRKEGRVWVQTLKGRGDGLLQRLEHEVTVPASAVDPRHPLPDPARHDGTEAGALLQHALRSGAKSDAPGSLQLLYRTDVSRLHRRVRHAGAVIEIAYDQGRLLAADRSEPIDEIEFELISGPPAALVSVAQRWVQRFGLWWDCRSKSERGMRLALGTLQVVAVHAVPLQWPAAAHGAGGAAAFGTAALHAAMRQALPNAAELASGSGTPEHLHQLRVALRRVRTLLRLWGRWLPDPDAAHALEQAWKAPFGVLGEARDADVRSSTLVPLLRAAGAPEIDPAQGTATSADVGVCLRGAAFTSLMLQTLALVLALQPSATQGPDTATAACRALVPAWRKVLSDAEAFEQADTAAHHRTRKRLKRLRYLLEALSPLYKPRATRRLLKALRRALKALGDLNDLYGAEAQYRETARTDPRAWFAVGWLAARREAMLPQVAAALLPLKDAPRVWRKPSKPSKQLSQR